jgi:hypothetical protein
MNKVHTIDKVDKLDKTRHRWKEKMKYGKRNEASCDDGMYLLLQLIYLSISILLTRTTKPL